VQEYIPAENLEDDIKIKNRNMILNFGDKNQIEDEEAKTPSSISSQKDINFQQEEYED